MNKVRRKHPDPEWSIGCSSSGQIWNKHLLTVDRSKELPRLRQNQAFWRGRKKILIIVALILIVVAAGIIIGVTVAISKKDRSSPSSASSSANPSNSASSIPLPPLPTSSSQSPSSLSLPTAIPSRQPIPATLATAFRSSSWIWLGAQALTGVPGGNWAFRKTLPTSTAPATQAVALLTVDNEFQLYHNGQLIAMSSDQLAVNDTDTSGLWQAATAVHVKLNPNSNVFAILAQNFRGDTDNNGTSAGLLASIQITYADGTTTTISSDDTWRVIQPVPDGFQTSSFNDAQWQSATVLIEYGSGPWGDTVVIPQSYNITAR